MTHDRYFEQLVMGRRSIRRFREKPVPLEDLREVVKLGAWAPSGGNAQSWRFVVVQDEAMLHALHSVSPGMLAPPPAVIAVCQDLERAYRVGGTLGKTTCAVMDSAMAAQNILLGVHAKGLGACPVLSFHEEAVRRLLSLPQHITVQLLIMVGWPAETPSPPRRNLEGVIYIDSYE